MPAPAYHYGHLTIPILYYRPNESKLPGFQKICSSPRLLTWHGHLARAPSEAWLTAGTIGGAYRWFGG